MVGERDTDAEIFETITGIRQEFEAFHETKTQPHTLSVSIGYSILNGENIKDIDALLVEADELMYREKRVHHAKIQ